MTRPAPLMVALAAAVMTACSSSSAGPQTIEQLPTAVRTAQIERSHRAQPIHATGVLASKTEVRASFKVGGVVAKLAVDEGDSIHAGQIVARLVTTEIDAGVEQARQNVTKTARDVARVARLFEGQAATREQLDDATTAAAVARAQLRAAEFNREHAVIRATANGRVQHRLVESGEIVAPGQPIMTISGEDTGWIVRVGLADRDIVRVAHGDKATLELAAYPKALLTATVAEIASAATAPLGTYEVELRVAFPPGNVRPLSGLVTSVTIEPTGNGTASEIALIPAAAVRDGDGKTATVWVPDGKGGVTRRAIEIGYFDGERIAIASGLDGATVVITDGAAYLNANSTITVSRERESGAK
ncbi:MAG: efflux transporter, family, subunit [Myxococcales bacterium]|nr:efflux transporter, family, subunit [Myxococcales bacterium]